MINSKELFVSTANRPIVGTLLSMGDVNEIFAVCCSLNEVVAVVVFVAVVFLVAK